VTRLRPNSTPPSLPIANPIRNPAKPAVFGQGAQHQQGWVVALKSGAGQHACRRWNKALNRAQIPPPPAVAGAAGSRAAKIQLGASECRVGLFGIAEQQQARAWARLKQGGADRPQGEAEIRSQVRIRLDRHALPWAQGL